MNPTQKQPNLTQKPQTMSMTCECKQLITAEVPTPEIANNVKTSVVTLSHEYLMSCVSCGRIYTLAISSCQLQLQFTNIPQELAPSIILAAGGLNNGH